MSQIKWIQNSFKHFPAEKGLEYFSKLEMQKTADFHATIPVYKPTPLRSLTGLAEFLGVKSIYVKDESQRFGLNAFKGLGASYAMGRYFSEKLSIDMESTSFQQLTEKAKYLDRVTFATATDGNHGKGVAWAAKLFGQEAKVFMPKGSAAARLKAIQDLGADACITGLNYDDTVQMVADLAEKHHWILIQDTEKEGFEHISLSIMQGYITIISEAMKEFDEQITHVFLQAGVGSFPAAVAAAIYNIMYPSSPKIIVVEPEQADCFYQSALNPTGMPQRVHGDLSTMMAGLACGEPNPVAWNILKSIGDYFFSCDDSVSATGMRVLGNPIVHDERIISGESGAVPIGLVYKLMKEENLEETRRTLELDHSSVIFVINTEGDTDPVNYRKIVWEAD